MSAEAPHPEPLPSAPEQDSSFEVQADWVVRFYRRLISRWREWFSESYESYPYDGGYGFVTDLPEDLTKAPGLLTLAANILLRFEGRWRLARPHTCDRFATRLRETGNAITGGRYTEVDDERLESDCVQLDNAIARSQVASAREPLAGEAPRAVPHAALPELTEPPKQTDRYDALERVWGIVETRLRLSGDSPITEQQKDEAYRAGEKEILRIFGSDQTAMGHYIAACGLSGSSFDTQKAQEFRREVEWVKKELRLRIEAYCRSRDSLGTTAKTPPVEVAGVDVSDTGDVGADAQSLTRHSVDFRSVHWCGQDHTFTDTQAACVKVLWEAMDHGTPDVGDITVIARAGSNLDSGRLRDLFRDHPAWGTMIVKGQTKGTHRLADRNKNENSR